MKAHFQLATPADDAAIRRLLANSPVPGSITLTYEREPDYFLGCGTMGHFWQVPIAKHSADGTLLGVSCRATRPLFVNGQAEDVGYLGQLRIDRRYQGRWLLSQAFRYLRQLHADGRVEGYITTIIEGNPVAEGVLVTRARRHFPAYRQVDRLCTLALIVSRAGKLVARMRRRVPAGITLHAGTRASLEEIVAFLQQYGAQRQFFPVYRVDDFGDSPLTRDFRVEDFVVARRGGKIVGVIGLWDQSRYKQTVVQSYHHTWRWFRLLYNAGTRLVGAQSFPPPGGHLHAAYASFVCIKQNDLDVFRVLLDHVYALAVQRGYAYVLLGLTTSDPLLAVARRYIHIPYYSKLYTVCWSNEQAAPLYKRLDGRVPYVEIAAL